MQGSQKTVNNFDALRGTMYDSAITEGCDKYEYFYSP